MNTATLKTGLTKGANHLVLKAVYNDVQLSQGLNHQIATYLVYEMDFGIGYPAIKKILQIHQYDTKVKALRKFDRLNVVGK